MKNFLKKYISSFLLVLISIIIPCSFLHSQEKTFRNKSWRLGAHGALQVNSSGLGWQQLHGTDGNFHSPEDNIDYVDGTGSGFYGGIFGEYLSTSWWGVQFRVSYDNRSALIIDDTRNPIPSFDTKMSYLVFEPLFRIDQNMIPKLSFTAGPFLATNIAGAFVYNSDYNNTGVSAAVTEPETNVENLNSLTYGLQGGIAYDINVYAVNRTTSVLLSPFMDISWIVNQKEVMNEADQNSISDVWSSISYRFGIRLSLDYATLPDAPIAATAPTALPVSKRVSIILPFENTILTKNIRGYFPIHPYVFFEKGSTEIPTRYTTLSKADAQNFKESDLTDFMKGDLTVKETNVNQLMTSYYNVMNIYADRMRANPSEQLTLRGCDPDEKDGQLYANTVKNYLVNNFGIDPKRIDIIVEAPKKPSGTLYTDPTQAALIDDENRRVVFVFDNPDMLNSLSYTIRDESSIDNDMIFSIDRGTPFKTWDMIITGEGNSMYFGPFAYSSERVNPAQLMRFLSNGTYNAKVVITENSGRMTEENIPFTLNKSRELKNASRYIMLFDYAESGALARYENRIVKEIVPEMMVGNKVIVHGHTDIIGSEEGNLKLSQERADQAKGIIDTQLSKESKSISVQAIGIGETQMQYTFTNKYPEGRMYNRNVFVEVIQ